MKWSKLSETEISLAKKWYLEEDLSAAKIAQRLDRSASTISRLVTQKVVRQTVPQQCPNSAPNSAPTVPHTVPHCKTQGFVNFLLEFQSFLFNFKEFN